MSRLVLDNILNLQVSWVTMGSGVAQVALQFGANDFGSTMIEENVVAAAGIKHRLSVEEIRKIIRDAGYEPRQRNMGYELIDDTEKRWNGDTAKRRKGDTERRRERFHGR